MIELFIAAILLVTGGAPSALEITPGKLVRFATSGKRGDKSGWCKLFGDGEGGVFGCWRQGISETWQSLTPRTEDEMADFRERVRCAREEATRAEEQSRAECRKQSIGIWEQGRDVSADHPYILKKGIRPYGARQLNDSLLIPVWDMAGTLHGLQFIMGDGSKWFKPGTAVTGNYHLIGEPTGKLYICEGWATACTVHEVSGHAVATAFTAGALKAVAVALREKYPGIEVTLCADDDLLNAGNPGLTKATEAALTIGVLLAVPEFPETRGAKDTDFNDLALLSGADAVKSCLSKAKRVEAIPLSSLDAETALDAATATAAATEATTEVPTKAPEAPTEAGTTEATTESRWPKPHPLPDGLLPVRALAVDMIPAPFQGWLEDISYRMQAPIDFAATAAIVALASIIGRGCGIYPKKHDNWLVIPNLWGAAVGLPSVMKTPAIAEGLKPLVSLEIAAQREYQKEIEAYVVDSEVVEIQKKAICENIKKALKQNPSADVSAFRAELAKAKSDEPIRRRYQTQDATVEKIGELLNENTRGLLISRDELVGWLHTLGKPGHESDRAFHLEAWNGSGRFSYDRITRGTIDIEATCESIFGAVTPGPLADYIRQAVKGETGNDGLIQRLQMLVYPDTSAEWVNIDRYPDTEQKIRAYAIFKALSGDIPGAVREDDDAVPALRFSPAGQDSFDAWRYALETRLRSVHGLHPAMVSHIAKYRSLMPSLALIFHLVDVADGSTEPGPVSERAVLMAAAWCEYLESHAARVYGAATAPGTDAAREIVTHIKRREIKDGCKPKEIYRHQWSGLATPADVKAGLDVLMEYDWLTVEKTTTGGRPSEIIRLNPRLKI